MVNRERNFNRRYQKKLKVIRNIRKSKTGTARKNKPKAQEKLPEGHQKKMSKRQERFNNICNTLKINVSDIFSKRRKNKKNKNKNQEQKMDLE